MDEPEVIETVAVEEPQEDGGERPHATLTVFRNDEETEEVFDVYPPATIGRFDPTVGPIDVDLGSIPEGSYVSRKHARITLEDGVWRIEDLGSSNGVFLKRDDFERVTSVELADGDQIALGNARFLFRIG
ncbi:MAG: hypothetical protein HONBIEJF_02232 [Fimbriimonadaceae bacterium]|nr:hypothetical protein [Fimbriimonadaceae bacterium]